MTAGTAGMAVWEQVAHAQPNSGQVLLSACSVPAPDAGLAGPAAGSAAASLCLPSGLAMLQPLAVISPQLSWEELGATSAHQHMEQQGLHPTNFADQQLPVAEVLQAAPAATAEAAADLPAVRACELTGAGPESAEELGNVQAAPPAAPVAVDRPTAVPDVPSAAAAVGAEHEAASVHLPHAEKGHLESEAGSAHAGRPHQPDAARCFEQHTRAAEGPRPVFGAASMGHRPSMEATADMCC